MSIFWNISLPVSRSKKTTKMFHGPKLYLTQVYSRGHCCHTKENCQCNVNKLILWRGRGRAGTFPLLKVAASFVSTDCVPFRMLLIWFIFNFTKIILYFASGGISASIRVLFTLIRPFLEATQLLFWWLASYEPHLLRCQLCHFGSSLHEILSRKWDFFCHIMKM